MKTYWESADGVRDMAKLLTYITKTKDPDGPDLYFLSSEKKYKIPDASSMRKKIEKHDPKAETSLYGAFDYDLRSYGQEVDLWATDPELYRRRHKRTRPTKRSVYVLTDGAWVAGQDNQGVGTIRFLVDKLARAGLDRNQVGIQFISFGQHPDGLRRLEVLDRLKKSHGLAL